MGGLARRRDADPECASATYTFAAPDFINTGGDGYTMFLDGIATTRELMADVFREHLEAAGTVTPATDGRIQNTPAP